MNKIRIKDRDALIKIFRTIYWLDNCSWNKWNEEIHRKYLKFLGNDLSNSEKILTHWICYITDKQMPWEKVWNKGGYIFSEIVCEYTRNKLTTRQVLDKYKQDSGKERCSFKSSNAKIKFTSRYPNKDYQNILQTLEVLNNQKYERNIIDYIFDIIQKYLSEEDLLMRVAFGLHLLTYQLTRGKENHNQIMDTLNNKEKFNEKLKNFKITSTEGKKRLWCCIRDYKKGIFNKIFNEALKEVFGKDAERKIEIWNNLPMDQIELPGDVWNNKPCIKEKLLVDVIDISSIPETWKMPKIIRNLYNQLKSEEVTIEFYPIQFDITFSFVQRMCENKLCSICLFGKNGVEQICIPSFDKFCPVALLSAGYIFKCTGPNSGCIIEKENIGKGICKEY